MQQNTTLLVGRRRFFEASLPTSRLYPHYFHNVSSKRISVLKNLSLDSIVLHSTTLTELFCHTLDLVGRYAISQILNKTDSKIHLPTPYYLWKLFLKLDFYWFLIHQLDFEGNAPQIRIGRIEIPPDICFSENRTSMFF